jgi:putative selenate reductase
VLGIPRQNFAVPGARLATSVHGHALAAPLGVAAGPQTQLAQNIVSSWLCGARFIELKTVQVLDELTVSRPCIDAADEAYNCEWSQELKLEQSFTEYLNAWVLLHALAHALGMPGPGVLFSMSVGYDLQGIQSPRVSAFLAAMRDARAALPAAVEAVAKAYPAVRDLDISRELSDHVTLSTMHGCPPSEIERIARHLLLDVGVHTWVKVNPTLLGPERLRGLLNGTLRHGDEVPDAAFDHDPTFPDAMAMVRALAAVARGRPQRFGLKLTNTLEVRNHRSVFPENEKMMYLSGRALHPLTLELSRKVAEELDGAVPISFCGGADARNFPQLIADGLGPVTVCTDLLKPGGYARLGQYLQNLDADMARLGAADLDGYVAATSGGRGARWNLAAHARAAAGEERFARRERPLTFKGDRALQVFDCIAAPCVEACPAEQNIPDYLWHVAQGKPTESLEVILRTNPQPGITGSICEHPCTDRCVRNFYDAPLAIREVKRFAFEQGQAAPERRGSPRGVKVAVVGAGPAGLAAASFLGRMGFEVVLYEAKASLGGMVSGVIPDYRLTGKAIEGDLRRLRDLGVRIEAGRALGRDLQLSQLRRDFPYVFLAVGAQRGKRLGLPGEGSAGVLDALEFLDRVRNGEAPGLGRRVLVVGGGNTAMDAVRTAQRLVGAGGGEVTIVYRRTRAEMPAEASEVHDALEEGVRLRELVAPTRVVTEGGRVAGLACTPLTLSGRDASGRPRPVPSGAPEVILPADTVITAIGQEPILDFLGDLEVARQPGGTLSVDARTRETSVQGLFAGGDVVRGAASVIEAIGDGRAVADEIGRRHGTALPPEPELDKQVGTARNMAKKALHVLPQTVPVLPLAQRGGFAEVTQAFTAEVAAAEASRCLDCDDVCSLCVTVCPNRANQAFSVAPMAVELPSLAAKGGRLVPGAARRFQVAQSVQIVKIGDFCNDCGNCDTFCPTSGAPYKVKPSFWLDEEGFREARGDAYRMERDGGSLVVSARLSGRSHRLESRDGGAEYRSDQVVARFARDGAQGWKLLGVEAAGPLADGERVDLDPCGTLLALLAAEPVLPVGLQQAPAPAARPSP